MKTPQQKTRDAMDRAMGKKRRVRITIKRNTWFVMYVDREKGQRYHAAQFYAPNNSRADVERWVNNNPKLELVNEAP